MLFNSVTFLVFFALFTVIYFQTRDRVRLAVCLLGSYVFYGWWDWRFLGLLLYSTTLDYVIGLRLAVEQNASRRKRLIALSITSNLGVLGFFKYFGFFVSSAAAGLHAVGLEPEWGTLSIVLPVGISFYTFQSISYTVDVYRRHIEAERDFVRFAAFVALFPQLVAGPIVRATQLLPQMRVTHSFDWERLLSGLQRCLWGFFKKVCVADSLALVVDPTFRQPVAYSSLALMIGVVFYAFQIYCDFSGYSDIAIGTARILGFDFPENFRMPYFSRSFSEFWTRWHISLSTWLRDYLYIPLGGNRNGPSRTYRNLAITMLLGGLWHGANWTFVIWGALHGAYLVLQRILSAPFGKAVQALRVPNSVRDAFLMALVFALTCLAWVFFRAQTLESAVAILQRIVSVGDLSPGSVKHGFHVIKGFCLIATLVAAEVVLLSPRSELLRRPAVRSLAFATALWAIALTGTFESNQFIYFQF